MSRIVIMAGGTGGHLFPALAVASELQSHGVEVSWMGTRHGMESRLVPEHGFAIDYISISGVRRRGVVGWLLLPFRLLWALLQSLQILINRRPGVVLGMGGFASGPGGIAARVLWKPLILHEQNAIAGLTNSLLKLIASRVLEAFPGTFSKDSKVSSVGNPVRREITNIDSPEVRLRGRATPLRLLVIGGSLGATILNEMVPAAVAEIGDSKIEIRHQSGEKNIEQAEQCYRDAGVVAAISPFIDDMAEALTWADLVIARAGALTVSELAAAGVASILVPYPYAVDDHQSANGRYLADAGAALLVPQSQLTAVWLAEQLHRFTSGEGRAQLLKMAQQARSVAKPDATERVARVCLEMVGDQS